MPYENLPGFTTVLRDNRMFVMPETLAGNESILILGTAYDGPVGVPVRAGRIDTLERMFGGYTGDAAGATLIPAVQQAIESGASDVRAMRVSGEYATYSVMDTTEVAEEIIVVRGRFPGTKYQGVKVTADATSLTITNLNDEPSEYTLSEYDTVGALVNAINSETGNDASAVVGDDSAFDTSLSGITLAEVTAEELTGGSTGINVSQSSLRSDVNTAYGLIEDYEVDIVVPVGVYLTYDLEDLVEPITDSDKQGVLDLAEHCYTASQRVGERHGVIGVKPLDSVTLGSIASLADALSNNPLEYEHSTMVDDDGNPIDVGKFISIVCADTVFDSNRAGPYISNGAAAYAGLINTLAAESATTNKVVGSALGLAYSFSPAQLDSLTEARYVTFRGKIGRGVVVIDGITAAKSGSDYTRLSTVRIVNAACNSIREVTQPYIGEAGTPYHFNAMSTAIESVLSAMQAEGALQNYRFNILTSPLGLARGEATIELELVPAFELRKIVTVVTVRATLN